MITWLPGASVHDLHPGIGNGPFTKFLGVVLHVNVDEYGTPDSFWGNGNPGQVCPNFQVYKDGSIHQMLPLDWQPWCQIDGNFNYAAIETAGLPTEPLTAAQLAAIAKIVRAYHDNFGMPLVVTDTPGQPGLITHQAGGAAWGGHTCPGAIRAGQRSKIVALAQGASNPDQGEEMALSSEAVTQIRNIVHEEVGKYLAIYDPATKKWDGGDHAVQTVVARMIAQVGLDRVAAEVDAIKKKLGA